MTQNRSKAVMQRRVEPHDSRSALAAGLTRYFTGRPCVRGHVAERNARNGTCLDCARERDRIKRLVNPEHERALDRARHERDKEKRRDASRRGRAAAIEARREYDRQRYRGLDRREAQFAQARRWRAANPGKVNAITAARRRWIKRATPLWLTDEQRAEIKTLYKQAAAFGSNVMHVDHIVPLRGRNVCGLNVPWNLQLLPASTNRAKGNHYAE